MNNQQALPTLDAHAHVRHSRSDAELSGAGAILAMTLSIEEATHAVLRHDPFAAWGVGCHPGDVSAQQNFDAHAFKDLIKNTPVVGEVGLDNRSQVPFETQLKNFRAILEIITDNPRLVSIHSNHATTEVLDELARIKISVPVLHWWSGSNGKTKTAVQIGCYFSINPKIAQHSVFSKHVPLDRILFETDHNYDDPPGTIPALIESTELAVAGKYGLDPLLLRQAAWKNFRALIESTSGMDRLPPQLRAYSEAAL